MYLIFLVVDHWRETDELTILFNTYLTRFISEASNETLKNVSLLDMPGFGSMLSSPYEEQNCCKTYCDVYWPNQLSFFHILMNKSEQEMHVDCKKLNDLWFQYMKNLNGFTNDFRKCTIA